MQKSSSGFDLKPGSILTVPAHKNESRFKATESEENKEPAELLGDGQFELTDKIKKQYEIFDKIYKTNEKCERRITVTGVLPS